MGIPQTKRCLHGPLSSCPEPLVCSWVVVRQPVDRIPIVPRFAERREVQITHTNAFLKGWGSSGLAVDTQFSFAN